MAQREISYPYPVFGNADDITTGQPDLAIESVDFNGDDIKLHFSGLKTNNSTIDSLIESGKANWVVQLRCGRTYFRQALPLAGLADATIKVAADELMGIVEAESYIVSNAELTEYTPEGMHTDYNGCSFTLREGATLGVGLEFKFTVDPGFDPMRDSIASIVNISVGDFPSGPFKVNWHDENIQIYLSKADWALYPAARNNSSAILHSALVLPVISEAIHKLSDDDVKENRWASRLLSLLAAKELDHHEDPLYAAQQLLQSPVNRVLEQVQREMDGEGDE